ncbi:hypothetical protein [Streptomyces sp. MJP52]|uniref:hypothetical protein n=1 Tax=Streptomyces sp. MJP52 TaxID=2940555 RepID=UPI00247483B8|nr:hypothetical protein [Streptomyces sp. MJP52]MDH6225299.1 hypothetical protein [Streptomyces sp. MJP52]
MPTAISVSGSGLVLPSADRHTPPAALQPRATVEDTVHELNALVEQHGYVVAVHPAVTDPAVVRRLHTARSLLETDRVAILAADLPPLGVALLVQQLRQLSVCDFGPGVLASAARLLAHYIYAGALLNSVAKLDHVPVTLTAHAKSWMPGAQFAVLATPRPALVRLGGEDRLPGPEFGTRMVAATGPGFGGATPPDWVGATLAPGWRVQHFSTVPVPAESASWWGTPKLVEFAAGLPDVSVLYQLVSSVRRDVCRWCGLELIGDRCAFCASPLAPPPEFPAATHTVSGTAAVAVTARAARSAGPPAPAGLTGPPVPAGAIGPGGDARPTGPEGLRPIPAPRPAHGVPGPVAGPAQGAPGPGDRPARGGAGRRRPGQDAADAAPHHASGAAVPPQDAFGPAWRRAPGAPVPGQGLSGQGAPGQGTGATGFVPRPGHRPSGRPGPGADGHEHAPEHGTGPGPGAPAAVRPLGQGAPGAARDPHRPAPGPHPEPPAHGPVPPPTP